MNREGHLQVSRSIIILMTVAYTAIAGAGQDSGLERCARLVSDSERLACFDEILKQPQERSEVPDSVGSSQSSGTAPEAEVGEQSSEMGAVTQSEIAVQETQPSGRQDESPTNRSDRPKEYTAAVVEINERPHGQKVVTLDDGEVWSEQYASRAFLVNVGDTVTMKKGLLSSSYRLIAPGGRAYKMTRLDQ